MSDIISRQAALERFRSWLSVKGYSTGELNMLKAVLCELEAMPSVEPTHVNASNTLKTLDCISRQAAIDALCRRCDLAADDDEPCTEKCNDIKILEKLPPAQPKPEWIPCSERLPDKNGRYLCTNSRWGAYEVDWNAWINGEWLYPNEKPVAWMPLPESYGAERRKDG